MQREGPRQRTEARGIARGRSPGSRLVPVDRTIEEDDWPNRELRLGFDTRARLLETVVLIFKSGEEMAIHAMPARRQYWDLLP